jgi:ribosome maturation factor RimP
MNLDFKRFVNKKASILLDFSKPRGSGKENYVGTITEVHDDFIVVENIQSPRTDIEQVVIHRRRIASLWIYKEGNSL